MRILRFIPDYEVSNKSVIICQCYEFCENAINFNWT